MSDTKRPITSRINQEELRIEIHVPLELVQGLSKRLPRDHTLEFCPDAGISLDIEPGNGWIAGCTVSVPRESIPSQLMRWAYIMAMAEHQQWKLIRE